jgi:hypothetical protein
MTETLEGILKDQAISFPQLHRYSRWTQSHSLGCQIRHGRTTTWSSDPLNPPHSYETRSTSVKHSFDTHKARAVLERR